MKIVAVIPSRYGSSRFAGKPLALIAGRPMIRHVYERAARAPEVDEVWVATDDPRIYEAVEAFGGRALMTAASHRSGTDRLAEAAAILGLRSGDLVVNVQGDQPLLEPRCIAELLAPLRRETDVEICTLAYRIVRASEVTDPKDVKVVCDSQGFALYFSRATIPFDRDGDSACEYYKHLGLYAYTRRFLEKFQRLSSGRLERLEKLEQLRALEAGWRIRVVVTEYDSPEVDLPADIERVERLLSPGH